MAKTMTGEDYIPYAELTPELRRLVEDGDWRVRFDEAYHGHGLDKLVADEDPRVREEVARQGYALDKLVDDEDKFVRREVAHQGYGLDKLSTDESELVTSAVWGYLDEHEGMFIDKWIKANPDKCAYLVNKKAEAIIESFSDDARRNHEKLIEFPDGETWIGAGALPKGWYWKSFPDGTGSLCGPENERLFNYDLASKEMKDFNGQWTYMPEMTDEWRRQCEEQVQAKYLNIKDEFAALKEQGYYPIYNPVGTRYYADAIRVQNEMQDYDAVAVSKDYAVSRDEFLKLSQRVHDLERENWAPHTISDTELAQKIAYALEHNAGVFEYEHERFAVSDFTPLHAPEASQELDPVNELFKEIDGLKSEVERLKTENSSLEATVTERDEEIDSLKERLNASNRDEPTPQQRPSERQKHRVPKVSKKSTKKASIIQDAKDAKASAKAQAKNPIRISKPTKGAR